jgi:hypothetical protein
VHCPDLGFEAPNERGLTTQVVKYAFALLDNIMICGRVVGVVNV